jgi:hypothetical protein
MEVETLGMARSLGWKVHMRRANGCREATRSIRRCVQTPFIRDGSNTKEAMATHAGRGVGVQK